MLIVGVHFDAPLPAWSGLEIWAIILLLLSPHYPLASFSISVLPHLMLTALIPLYALHPPPHTHTHALILHLPHGTPLLHPPKCPSPEYEIRLLSSTEVQEWDAWRANCWCVGFWVIITSLSLQENSKLMFNFPLLLKGSPPLLLPWQLAEAKA